MVPNTSKGSRLQMGSGIQNRSLPEQNPHDNTARDCRRHNPRSTGSPAILPEAGVREGNTAETTTVCQLTSPLYVLKTGHTLETGEAVISRAIGFSEVIIKDQHQGSSRRPIQCQDRIERRWHISVLVSQFVTWQRYAIAESPASQRG